MTSLVFGPAAARRCFNMVRQYSSDQSCIILARRKTETSSCRAGWGTKKSWPWGPKCQLRRMEVKVKRTLELHAAGFDCVGLIFLPVLSYCRYVSHNSCLGSLVNNNARTSTAFRMTGSRS
jgi:hypothetical protein